MNTPDSPSPQHHLTSLRIIWAAMLAGQVMFLVIVLWLIGQSDASMTDPQVGQMIFVIALVTLVAGVPVAYLLRMRIYGGGQQPDGTVSPQAYTTGNIILLALCEGPSLLAVVGMLLARQVSPFILVTILAIAVQAVNFPTGAPLRRD